MKSNSERTSNIIVKSKKLLSGRKKRLRIYLASLTSIILLICAVLVTKGLTASKLLSDESPKDNVIVKADFAYDVDKPNEVIGDADYTFVAYVNELSSTTHRFVDGAKGKKFDRPCTNYTITILENIKGNLRINKPIPIQKFGGLREDGKILLHENDCLPEKNKIYIFMAYAQKDGSLLVSGPNSNIPLELNIKRNNIDKSEIVAKYKEAFNNQVPKTRDSNKSIYEDPNIVAPTVAPTTTPISTPTPTLGTLEPVPTKPGVSLSSDLRTATIMPTPTPTPTE
jgi:hypothetical protein